MTFDFRYPKIQGKTEAEQLAQVKSYLNQLVDQLNWALNNVEAYQGGNTSVPVVNKQSEKTTHQEAQETFDSIKELIIKSADIVKAYEETIVTHMDGKYVAESDFGTFVETTNKTVEENSKGVAEHYRRIQEIDTNMDGLQDYVDITSGYIHRGILSDGSVGIEVGETDDDGSFTKYARFTADKLSFYDKAGNEVAYIGAGCLYVVGKTVFIGVVQLGGYKMDATDGLAFTWIG